MCSFLCIEAYSLLIVKASVLLIAIVSLNCRCLPYTCTCYLLYLNNLGWTCDQADDCGDSSDEAPNLCGKTKL